MPRPVQMKYAAKAINYSPANRTAVIKMCFFNAVSDDNCIYRDMDLEIARDIDCNPGQIELCRFKLQEGAKLRCALLFFCGGGQMLD